MVVHDIQDLPASSLSYAKPAVTSLQKVAAGLNTGCRLPFGWRFSEHHQGHCLQGTFSSPAVLLLYYSAAWLHTVYYIMLMLRRLTPEF